MVECTILLKLFVISLAEIAGATIAHDKVTPMLFIDAMTTVARIKENVSSTMFVFMP